MKIYLFERKNTMLRLFCVSERTVVFWGEFTLGVFLGILSGNFWEIGVPKNTQLVSRKLALKNLRGRSLVYVGGKMEREQKTNN
jgi:hypothetical protein